MDKPILEMPDLDALVHLLETNPDGDLPGPPYYLYEVRGSWYAAYVLGPGESEELEYVGMVSE